MAYVPVPKDLDKIKTKVAFNINKWQLIGFAFAGLIEKPVNLTLKKYLPKYISIIFLLIFTFPVFYITFFDKDGLTFEKYFKYFYLHKFYQPQKRVRKEVYLEEKRKANAKFKSDSKTTKKGQQRLKRSKNK